nr:hypothetical protein [Candidatus Sigynarchaeota archaeon]
MSDTSYNETFDSGLTYNWSAYNELGLRDSDWQISCGGYTIVPPVQGMYSFNFIDLYLPNDTYALEVDFKNVVDGGILFGGRDASNFVVLGVLSNEIYIQNREGNVWTTRYAIVLLDQYGPTNFHLKLVIENQNAIKFYLNGTLKLDTTFVLFSPVGRQVGLFMNRNYSGEAFDNFTYYASLPSQDNFPIPINRTITLISISVISCLVILFTISTKMKERFLKQKKLVATKASDSNKAAFSSHAVSIIDEDYSLKHYPAFFLNQYSIPQNKQS